MREIIEISKKDEESARRRGKRKLSERERDEEIRKLEKQMPEASRMLEFEYAAILRDRIIELRKETRNNEKETKPVKNTLPTPAF